MTFQRFTLTFLNHQGKSLNLKEIAITKSTKIDKQKKLKFVTRYKHKLNKDEQIEIQIYQKHETAVYSVQVDSVIDDHTFLVDNVFETLSTKIVVLRPTINCSFQFRLFEINWNLLTKKNLQNAQLIRLSQLVKDRRKEISQLNCTDQDIINYVKTQPSQMPAFKGDVSFKEPH
jgi:hypothetical protein